MLDCELELLGSEGDLIVEGAWLRNPLLCGVLAQLRGEQAVYLSCDETGTVSGAAQLAFADGTTAPGLIQVNPCGLAGLYRYRDSWRELIRNRAAVNKSAGRA